MFVMMNEARLGVVFKGSALSEVAYQNAVAYARDRLQGRSSPARKIPEKPADPLIVHPDIRRILLEIRCFNEAGRALALRAALQSDIAHRSPTRGARKGGGNRLGLLTPVLKGVLTDGLRKSRQAQQVFGGHGYIAEWGMEQFVRDARIAMIYEGANGIQALDLVGRKLPANGGRAIMALLGEIGACLKANDGDEALKPCSAVERQPRPFAAGDAVADAERHGRARQRRRRRDRLHASARTGSARLYVGEDGAGGESRSGCWPGANSCRRKQACALFFAQRILPETAMRLARITAGAANVMSLPADCFDRPRSLRSRGEGVAKPHDHNSTGETHDGSFHLRRASHAARTRKTGWLAA